MTIALKAHDADRIVLRAEQLNSPVTDASGVLMFAPGGIHTITPAAGEGSAEVTLRIDQSTADVLNASLQKVNRERAPQRAFFDKNHEGTDATAWPIAFFWSDSPEPGVYARTELTALGNQLITGKIIRAFSPSVYSDAALPKRIARGQHVQIAAGKRGSPPPISARSPPQPAIISLR